jgi:uncharacterized damage-inducible protein DinB
MMTQKHRNYEGATMTVQDPLISTIYQGWGDYQAALIQSIAPLTPDQLSLKASPKLRSVAQIAAHMIGARARWFSSLMDEGGNEFEALGRWDRREARARTAQELVHGLNATWDGMQQAIAGWTEEDWQATWPGEDESEPEIITRQWVIWHLIEHDLHHGGEISLTMGVHGLKALEL